MQIDVGRLYGLVSQQCLNGRHVSAILKHMGREAVAKRMDAHRLTDPSTVSGSSKDPLNTALGQPSPWTLTGKQPVTGLHGPIVLAQELQELRRQDRVTIL